MTNDNLTYFAPDGTPRSDLSQVQVGDKLISMMPDCHEYGRVTLVQEQGGAITSQLHRTDGPAVVINPNTDLEEKQYYLFGQRVPPHLRQVLEQEEQNPGPWSLIKYIDMRSFIKGGQPDHFAFHHTNDLGQLHNTEGPAIIKYTPSGVEYEYYVHGHKFPKNVWTEALGEGTYSQTIINKKENIIDNGSILIKVWPKKGQYSQMMWLKHQNISCWKFHSIQGPAFRDYDYLPSEKYYVLGHELTPEQFKAFSAKLEYKNFRVRDQTSGEAYSGWQATEMDFEKNYRFTLSKYEDGELHNTEGPARIIYYGDGSKEEKYFISGFHYSKDQWEIMRKIPSRGQQFTLPSGEKLFWSYTKENTKEIDQSRLVPGTLEHEVYLIGQNHRIIVNQKPQQWLLHCTTGPAQTFWLDSIKDQYYLLGHQLTPEQFAGLNTRITTFGTGWQIIDEDFTEKFTFTLEHIDRGLLHREDGPARTVFRVGERQEEYWYLGFQLTKEQFEAYRVVPEIGAPRDYTGWTLQRTGPTRFVLTHLEDGRASRKDGPAVITYEIGSVPVGQYWLHGKHHTADELAQLMTEKTKIIVWEQWDKETELWKEVPAKLLNQTSKPWSTFFNTKIRCLTKVKIGNDWHLTEIKHYISDLGDIILSRSDGPAEIHYDPLTNKMMDQKYWYKGISLTAEEYDLVLNGNNDTFSMTESYDKDAKLEYSQFYRYDSNSKISKLHSETGPAWVRKYSDGRIDEIYFWYGHEVSKETWKYCCRCGVSVWLRRKEDGTYTNEIISVDGDQELRIQRSISGEVKIWPYKCFKNPETGHVKPLRHGITYNYYDNSILECHLFGLKVTAEEYDLFIDSQKNLKLRDGRYFWKDDEAFSGKALLPIPGQLGLRHVHLKDGLLHCSDGQAQKDILSDGSVTETYVLEGHVIPNFEVGQIWILSPGFELTITSLDSQIVTFTNSQGLAINWEREATWRNVLKGLLRFEAGPIKDSLEAPETETVEKKSLNKIFDLKNQLDQSTLTQKFIDHLKPDGTLNLSNLTYSDLEAIVLRLKLLINETDKSNDQMEIQSFETFKKIKQQIEQHLADEAREQFRQGVLAALGERWSFKDGHFVFTYGDGEFDRYLLPESEAGLINVCSMKFKKDQYVEGALVDRHLWPQVPGARETRPNQVMDGTYYFYDATEKRLIIRHMLNGNNCEGHYTSVYEVGKSPRHDYQWTRNGQTFIDLSEETYHFLRKLDPNIPFKIIRNSNSLGFIAQLNGITFTLPEAIKISSSEVSTPALGGEDTYAFIPNNEKSKMYRTGIFWLYNSSARELSRWILQDGLLHSEELPAHVIISETSQQTENYFYLNTKCTKEEYQNLKNKSKTLREKLPKGLPLTQIDPVAEKAWLNGFRYSFQELEKIFVRKADDESQSFYRRNNLLYRRQDNSLITNGNHLAYNFETKILTKFTVSDGRFHSIAGPALVRINEQGQVAVSEYYLYGHHVSYEAWSRFREAPDQLEYKMADGTWTKSTNPPNLKKLGQIILSHKKADDIHESTSYKVFSVGGTLTSVLHSLNGAPSRVFRYRTDKDLDNSEMIEEKEWHLAGIKVSEEYAKAHYNTLKINNGIAIDAEDGPINGLVVMVDYRNQAPVLVAYNYLNGKLHDTEDKPAVVEIDHTGIIAQRSYKNGILQFSINSDTEQLKEKESKGYWQKFDEKYQDWVDWPGPTGHEKRIRFNLTNDAGHVAGVRYYTHDSQGKLLLHSLTGPASFDYVPGKENINVQYFYKGIKLDKEEYDAFKEEYNVLNNSSSNVTVKEHLDDQKNLKYLEIEHRKDKKLHNSAGPAQVFKYPDGGVDKYYFWNGKSKSKDEWEKEVQKQKDCEQKAKILKKFDFFKDNDGKYHTLGSINFSLADTKIIDRAELREEPHGSSLKDNYKKLTGWHVIIDENECELCYYANGRKDGIAWKFGRDEHLEFKYVNGLKHGRAWNTQTKQVVYFWQNVKVSPEDFAHLEMVISDEYVKIDPESQEVVFGKVRIPLSELKNTFSKVSSKKTNKCHIWDPYFKVLETYERNEASQLHSTQGPAFFKQKTDGTKDSVQYYLDGQYYSTEEEWKQESVHYQFIKEALGKSFISRTVEKIDGQKVYRLETTDFIGYYTNPRCHLDGVVTLHSTIGPALIRKEGDEYHYVMGKRQTAESWKSTVSKYQDKKIYVKTTVDGWNIINDYGYGQFIGHIYTRDFFSQDEIDKFSQKIDSDEISDIIAKNFRVPNLRTIVRNAVLLSKTIKKEEVDQEKKEQVNSRVKQAISDISKTIEKLKELNELSQKAEEEIFGEDSPNIQEKIEEMVTLKEPLQPEEVSSMLQASLKEEVIAEVAQEMSEIAEAGYRVAAKQLGRIVCNIICAKAPSAKNFLKTSFGKALIFQALGWILLGHPAWRDDDRVAKLAAELRVEGLTIIGEDLIQSLLGWILDTYQPAKEIVRSETPNLVYDGPSIQEEVVELVEYQTSL